MPQIGIGKPVRQQVERLQYRQARANQSHELLVEDEEPLQVEFFLAPQQARARRDARPPRLYRVDEEALLRIALAQLLLGAGVGRLIVNLAPAIRVFEDKLHR